MALPLVAAIAELVEHAPHHQEHGFSAGGPLLQGWRIGNATDLDAAGGEIDVEIAGDADRLSACGIDHRIGYEMLAQQAGFGRGKILIEPGIGTPRQIGPHPSFGIFAVRLVKLGGMPLYVERLDAAVAPRHRGQWRALARGPVRDRKADRLAKVIGVSAQAGVLRASARRTWSNAAPSAKWPISGAGATRGGAIGSGIGLPMTCAKRTVPAQQSAA